MLRDFVDRRGNLSQIKVFRYIDELVRKLINLLESDFDTNKYGHFTMHEKMKMMTVVSKAEDLPLRDKHREILEFYMDNYLKPELAELDGSYLIMAVKTVWKRHCLMNDWLKRFFSMADKSQQNNAAGSTLLETGHSAFHDKIFKEIKSTVPAAFHEQLMEDRQGSNIDRSALKGCSDLFVAMDTAIKESKVYDELEQTLIKYLASHTRSVASTWIDEESISSYLVKTEQCFQEELQRCSDCLEERSQKPILKTLESTLVAEKKDAILYKSTGLRFMLENDKRDDLARLYYLFQRVQEGLEEISKAVKDFVIDSGMNIIQQREQKVKEDPSKDKNVDEDYVKQLLSLLEEWKDKVKNAFGDHALLQKAMKEAFEVIVNKNGNFKHSNIELLATYSDQVLKGSIKLTEAEREDELERLIVLFSFVIEKDVFVDIYRNLLAKRLISGRTASRDAEISMISKLKLRHGAQFTGKLEGMLRDLEQGSAQMETFAEWRDAEMKKGHNGAFGNIPNVDFNVRILTYGWWPNFVQVDVKLPDLFETCQRAYEQYYYNISINRRLNWQNSEGTAVLKGKFPDKAKQTTKSYEITVKTLQAVFLLYFDEVGDKSVDFTEVRKQTQTTDDVAKRVLHSLSCNKKFKVLEKNPSGPKIKADDKFKLNLKFASSLRKFQIPMASLEEAHDPRKIELDRRAAIDAAIVRIMKTRQTMKHQDLIGEVLNQLQFFSPDMKVIRRRIEYCINNDYMERNTEDDSTYNYVA
eukprot:gb/GECG01006121.1/.p1 GENE.gb/GECG01006121.1/~~gb/GECG01006121.1/.p1  ORF type:complete len:754 (+),score=126.16 gb/GECG01006121.1/:1-2262(+)